MYFNLYMGVCLSRKCSWFSKHIASLIGTSMLVTTKLPFFLLLLFLVITDIKCLSAEVSGMRLLLVSFLWTIIFIVILWSLCYSPVRVESLLVRTVSPHLSFTLVVEIVRRDCKFMPSLGLSLGWVDAIWLFLLLEVGTIINGNSSVSFIWIVITTLLLLQTILKVPTVLCNVWLLLLPAPIWSILTHNVESFVRVCVKVLECLPEIHEFTPIHSTCL